MTHSANDQQLYVPPPPIIDVNQHYSMADQFCNLERLSQLCARFISHFFDCHDGHSGIKLHHFIYNVLRKSGLPDIVTFTALLYLLRVKTSQRLIRSPWGHGLFLTAYMLASKFIVDRQHSNRGWAAIGCKQYSLKDINEMERTMLSYLEWDLNVSYPEVEEFSARFCDSFTGPGPYPDLAYFIPGDAPIDATDEWPRSEPMVEPRSSYPHQEYAYRTSLASTPDMDSLGSTPTSSPFPITPADDQPQVLMYRRAPYETFTRNWMRHSQQGPAKAPSYLAPPAPVPWTRPSASAW
jgi:hypothetical protein